MPERVCVDGNEAAALVAHKLSEVVAIYPITPASPMGELADAWSAAGRANLWGTVPEVVEMQSEAGAAGALHGATQKGALATTFTASQGLLLMIPNLYKIAGELSPVVVHVAARSLATHALSIFGDHSDVMAVRQTGCAMLCASSVQEAHDFSLVAHAATLRSRVPFIHFFDGFRTSHEIGKISVLDDDDLRALVREDDVLAHRLRGLSPNRPVLRGTAQNPDVFFQAREAANVFHDAVPDTVQEVMDELAIRTGRAYRLVDYVGAPDAERVLVLMGSGVGAATEAIEALVAAGEKVGALVVRLYRPFPVEAFLDALPPTARSVAVLDRTKEPGAPAEPLCEDVTTVLARAVGSGGLATMPLVIGGRYGLSSKEFTPVMAKAALDELHADVPRHQFTVGIRDDVTGLSLDLDPSFSVPTRAVQAIFWGLGADGTVGANKASIKIIGEHTDQWAQGYFVYDSRKSGAVTTSHLRFGPDPVRSTYLIDGADFVACHQWSFLDRPVDLLGAARPGATFLLNSPYPPEDVWDRLPWEIQDEIIAKGLDLWVIDANRVAQDTGMANRINTVMQPCFFALSGVLPREEAIAAIKASVQDAYGKRGLVIVEQNHAAIDAALDALQQVAVPSTASSPHRRRPAVAAEAPDFVQRITARMLAGEGDLLPVSALPVDGTFPTGTARWERRMIATELPVWDPEICIDCAKCVISCPHNAIQMKVYEPSMTAGAPDGFLHKDFRSRDLPDHLLTIQVAPDDCTGCGVCVDVCPAKSKEQANHKALDMTPAGDVRDAERPRYEFFSALPYPDRRSLPHDTIKGSQLLEPLFEFSGACAGCGETPYLRLLSQLFGDRMVVANATGCSSIYGGNLPTTPWSVNAEGRGPAWSNSLFEDNAEFGLGLRLGNEVHQAEARRLLDELGDRVGRPLADAILGAEQHADAEVREQRERIVELKATLAGATDWAGRRLALLADELVRTSTWVVGGDGWAYDIGYGGLDHLMASGRDVNVLVLDTEVYSNTGGQASKSTPRGAIAKFAASGKSIAKKDLGVTGRQYGNVFVGQVALGASEQQTVRTLLEADAWPGPSLVIAYSTCIAHGIDMSKSISHMKDAVRSGYWPLYRFHPGVADEGHHPFQLDSRAPQIPLRTFTDTEARYEMLHRANPGRADALATLAQADVDERWRYYEQLAQVERSVPHLEEEPDA
jgi:pyruvate-ferredoxin/flavodoxin oxidoreductase